MADAVIVSRTEFYPVKPKTPLTLSVTIGDSQPGGTAVMLNGKPVGSGNPIVNLPIGKQGEDLADGEIECTTTVRDDSDLTNRTSVTYSLRGGKADKDFAYNVTVDQAGGRAVYVISFMLTS